MSYIIKLPEFADAWPFAVDVVLRPDGQLVSILVAVRPSLIEQGETESHSKQLHEIANMLEDAIGPMRAMADKLKPLDVA